MLRFRQMSLSDAITSHPMAALGILLTSVSAYYILSNQRKKMICNKKYKRSKSDETGYVDESGRKLGRRISFTSATMAMGSWPEEKHVCDPVINVAILFDAEDCPESKEVVKLIEVILQYERCAGVPVGTPGVNDWRFRECVDVDPMKLIRRVEMEGDDVKLFDKIDSHMHDDLRNGRGDLPWWEFLLVQNRGPGKSACVLRMEHCVADGLSLVNLFENLITYSDGTPMTGLIPSNLGKKFQRKDSKVSFLLKIFKAFISTVTLPSSRFDDGIFFRRAMGQDMIYNSKRKSIIFHPCPLDFIKSLKNAANVTVNDIFFTCLSQAIHDYCISQNCTILQKKKKHIQFRALLPIAFPRSVEENRDKTRALTNQWVFVSADMGVGCEDITERLAFVHKNMNKIKHSPLAYCTRKVQESLGPSIPSKTAKQTVFDSFCRHSLVFSNVPGPIRQCSFAGKDVVGCQMLFNNLIPQVGIITYHGDVFMNMIVDPTAIPDSDSLPVFYSRALLSLGEKLGVDVPSSVKENANKTW